MLRGISVSGGTAVGRAVVVRTDRGTVARLPVDPGRVEQECLRLREAAQAASRRLQALSHEHAAAIGSEVSAILSAHALIAVDPSFLNAIEKLIRRQHINAEWALRTVAEEFRQRLASSSDPLFSERSEDVSQVARSIGAELGSGGGSEFDFSSVESGSILVADELSPVQAARLDPRILGGIAFERGGANSHAAIIARSFGLPAVVGVRGLLDATARQRPMIVDGDRGAVEPRPTKEQIRRALERVKVFRSDEERRRARSGEPVVTRDGVRLCLRANLELAEESDLLPQYGAEGVGLFRSEFLCLRAGGSLPGVAEQRRAYEVLLQKAAPHPVVVRTYDLGGEKELAGPGRDNPALSVRGIRYSLSRPEEFREQLRALLQASAAGSLRILLPMISSPDEIAAARCHLEAVAQEEHIRVLPPLGAMIEIPSAAILVRPIARACDFLSIGTNDLAQYALAADRGDPSVAGYYRPTSPAVLRMIKWTLEAGRETGRPVAVCGELAGDPVGAAMLVGLGLQDLSMTPVLLPRIQELGRRFEAHRLGALAERALEASTAEEAEEPFRNYLREMSA
jgi:phosphotransferase system enzyme I (PtsI)